MSDLSAFLLARITEDEASARRWLREDYEHCPECSGSSGDGVPEFHSDRVLAECEAKRRIVTAHHPDRQLENWYWLERKCAECKHQWHTYVHGTAPTEIGPEQGCPTLRALAAVYADHPDYDEAWRA